MGETIGPLVINITDILTEFSAIASSYLVIFTSFAFGICYLLTLQLYSYRIAQSQLNNASNSRYLIENLSSNHLEFSMAMFWAVLNPGPFDMISPNTVEGMFAVGLSAVYQILIVIILLNLLIAVINSTIQKVNNNKNLCWKYHRSSIWIHFFNDAWALPPPFNLLINLIYLTVVLLKWLQNIGQKLTKKKKESIRKSCTMSKSDIKKRKEHMRLMKELINRYMIAHGMQREEKK